MPDMALYAPAEAWVAAHQEALEREYPGQYLYMNVRTLAYTIAPTHKEASTAFYEKFSPIPFEGWAILGIQLGVKKHGGT